LLNQNLTNADLNYTIMNNNLRKREEFKQQLLIESKKINVLIVVLGNTLTKFKYIIPELNLQEANELNYLQNKD